MSGISQIELLEKKIIDSLKHVNKLNENIELLENEKIKLNKDLKTEKNKLKKERDTNRLFKSEVDNLHEVISKMIKKKEVKELSIKSKKSNKVES